MSAESEISKIIREEKLIDPAELTDLDAMIQDENQPVGYLQPFLRERFRRRELLLKFKSWIKGTKHV